MNILWEVKNKTNHRQSCPSLLGKERVWMFFSLKQRMKYRECTGETMCIFSDIVTPKINGFPELFIVNEAIFTVLLDYFHS